MRRACASVHRHATQIRTPARWRFSPSGDDEGAFFAARDTLLDEFADADIEEFLLGWCPRKWSVPAEDADGICRAIGAYAQFMAQTGRLVGGVDRAAALTGLADDLAPTMRAEMDNPANFGMAKSLFAGLGDVSDLSDDELRTALQARMDAHNALPIEQRRALTDRFFEPEPEPESLPAKVLTAAAVSCPSVADLGKGNVEWRSRGP